VAQLSRRTEIYATQRGNIAGVLSETRESSGGVPVTGGAKICGRKQLDGEGSQLKKQKENSGGVLRAVYENLAHGLVFRCGATGPPDALRGKQTREEIAAQKDLGEAARLNENRGRLWRASSETKTQTTHLRAEKPRRGGKNGRLFRG
jgi:hypothetical protein